MTRYNSERCFHFYIQQLGHLYNVTISFGDCLRCMCMCMFICVCVCVPASENNDSKSGAPPSIPPPPPPADIEESLDSQSDSSFNLELSRNHHDQYDTQFAYAQTTTPPTMGTPAVTIIGQCFKCICSRVQITALIEITVRNRFFKLILRILL